MTAKEDPRWRCCIEVRARCEEAVAADGEDDETRSASLKLVWQDCSVSLAEPWNELTVFQRNVVVVVVVVSCWRC